MADYIIRAEGDHYHVRAFVAITNELTETARQYHQTSPVATAALGRLLTAGAMMGVMMKGDDDLLTLQIKGNGPLGGVIVTANAKGEVKGYVHQPLVDLPLKANGKLDVSGAIGDGMLQIIRDIGLKDPYIGQTELVSGEIAEDITYYYANSEQTPSVVALGVLVDRDYSVKQSGGFILQLMPEASENTITILENNIKDLPSMTQMLEMGLTGEEILMRLLNGLEVKILDNLPTKFLCDCKKERVERALISLGNKELQEMIEEGEEIELSCQFCNKNYHFSVEELCHIKEQMMK